MNLRITHFFLISLIFYFLSSETLGSTPVSGSTGQPLSANPISQEKEKVVAKVFGKTILLSEIIPKSESMEQYKGQLIPEQKKLWLDSERNEKLSALIWGPLVEEYGKTHDITPTKEEINAFIKQTESTDPVTLQHLRESEESYRAYLKQLEDRKKELDQELLEPNLTEEVRRQFTEELDTVNKELSLATHNLLEESAQRVAMTFVRAWKLNKSLYEQYGGRVIFQQAGPEPVDAFRDFLKEHEVKGDFKIYDEEFRKSFWVYFVGEGHSFYSEDEGKKFMQTPWWEMKPEPMK